MTRGLVRRRSLLASLAPLPARAANGKPWNIVLLFSDDHAYQAIGAYGNSMVPTPHIDRLAHEGMRFDQCLVTNSICAPSRAVVLTGKHSHVNGVIDNRRRIRRRAGTTVPQSSFKRPGIRPRCSASGISRATRLVSMLGNPHRARELLQPRLPDPERQHHRSVGYDDRHHRRHVPGLAQEAGTNTNKPFLLLSASTRRHIANWDAVHHVSSWMFDDERLPEPATLFDDYRDRTGSAGNKRWRSHGIWDSPTI